MALRVISASDVDTLTAAITAESLIRMLGATMYQLSKARVTLTTKEPPSIQSPIRISTETINHKVLYMPSKLGLTTSIKIVSVPTSRASKQVKQVGLPATTLLLDEETGKIKAVINASSLTGLRTASASALATMILAKSDSNRLLIFGTGIQALFHALLILDLFPSIIQVHFVGRVFDTRAEELIKRLNLWLEKRDRKCQVDWISNSIPFENILEQADIICTCVPSLEPLFESRHLKSTVHINSIGSYTPTMHEFPSSLISPTSTSLPKIPTILVDSLVATLAEAGELIDSGIQEDHIIEIGELVDDLGNILIGREIDSKRKSLKSGGMSLFKCVGVGVMDTAIGELIFNKAMESNIGAVVDF